MGLNRREDARPRRSALGTLAFIVFGPLVWALHLLLIYGSQTLLCVADKDALVMPSVLAATLLAFAAVAFAILRPMRAAAAFAASDWPEPLTRLNRSMMIVLAALSAFGILAEGAVAMVVSACASGH